MSETIQGCDKGRKVDYFGNLENAKLTYIDIKYDTYFQAMRCILLELVTELKHCDSKCGGAGWGRLANQEHWTSSVSAAYSAFS